MHTCSKPSCNNKTTIKGMCGKCVYKSFSYADELSPEFVGEGICNQPGCNTKRNSSGLCAKHYARYRKYGLEALENPVLITNKATGTCKTTRCNEPAQTKGFCKRHYQQSRKTEGGAKAAKAAAARRKAEEIKDRMALEALERESYG